MTPSWPRARASSRKAREADAGAVELPFEGGVAELGERRGDVGGGAGEHGDDGAEELEVEARETGGAFAEGGAGDGGDCAGQHHGATDGGAVEGGGARHGLD